MVGETQGRRQGAQIAALLLLCCAFCGCTSVYFRPSSDAFVCAAPEKGRPFEIVGPVHATTWQWVLFYCFTFGPTYLEAENLLIRRAKQLGADAVTDVRFDTESDSDETSLSHMGATGILPFIVNTRAYHFSGLAIKYTDKGGK
jgi:hypothetical protein